MLRVRIKPKTSFITNLTSSTIFGAACWAIKSLYGDERLERVFSSDTSLAFSNAYISGYLPTGETKKDKLKHIETGEYIDKSERIARVDHCMVSRDNKVALKHWIEYEQYEENNLDIYVSTDMFDIDEIKSIFDIMLINGLGKSRNKGKGQFELLDITEISVDELGDKNGAGYMVISDYIPNETDSTIGKYSARVINRKTVNGDKCVPVYVINAGSRFIGKIGDEVIGRLQYDKDTNTYLSGRAIAIPIAV